MVFGVGVIGVGRRFKSRAVTSKVRREDILPLIAKFTKSHCSTSPHNYFVLRTSSMPKQRSFGGYGRDEDGKQTRFAHSPGGKTQVGTQTSATTPNGHHEAWLLTRHDEKSLRRDNTQSIRNALGCWLRRRSENKTSETSEINVRNKFRRP